MANCYVKEVTNSGPNISIFRRISRESSGECFNPPERSRLFFAHERNRKSGTRDNVIGVACYSPANWTLKEPSGENHEDPYFHILTFLFVDPYHQNSGCGSQLVKMFEKDAFSRCKRDLRIMSAEKAVRFFRKNNFVICGDAVQPACSGSPLFNRLVPMEKVCTRKAGQSLWSKSCEGQKGSKENSRSGCSSSSMKATDIRLQRSELTLDKNASERTEPVLQWNMSNYQVESTEDWDDE